MPEIFRYIEKKSVRTKLSCAIRKKIPSVSEYYWITQDKMYYIMIHYRGVYQVALHTNTIQIIINHMIYINEPS